ncbi:hypothetical protein PCH_Pc13g03040 [Penicillium rubens Wisconsin 54-1255]|uniref:Uncharacterized protein n=1 Tax=Penicillium rubens (strain ATCC 28089 / DSM 1075 / NRRL 1951 / Wisconsin 54-1255) TaxID=500485 RepID=B6H208_PENRW|nr:hypothetical protein PCH_Pc13g03040 [Penicillium rubens Wisconsin 54-1255]
METGCSVYLRVITWPRILGELKTFGTLLGLSMIKVLLWPGDAVGLVVGGSLIRCFRSQGDLSLSAPGPYGYRSVDWSSRGLINGAKNCTDNISDVYCCSFQGYAVATPLL